MEPTEKEMWAYWDNKRQSFLYVYNRELLVRMCSPDRFQRDEKEGRGKVVKVKVTPFT